MIAMRDLFLENLYNKMKQNKNIFFLSADFGSPVLDKIKADFQERFINVGIAEQNLINVATGLALEGFDVYVYAIAPFVTMRCFEQIRVDLAIMSELKTLNVNLIGVGAGVSYAMSGPTHHCLEDISIMNTLPNMEIFSPSDPLLVQSYVERTLKNKYPKYLRFDAQPLENLQHTVESFADGFRVLKKGEQTVAVVATGFMVQKVFKNSDLIDAMLVDLYLINRFDKVKLKEMLEDVETIITLEEGFVAGGLSSEINTLFQEKKVINLGFDKGYSFEIGSREAIHEKNGIGIANIIQVIKESNEDNQKK